MTPSETTTQNLVCLGWRTKRDEGRHDKYREADGAREEGAALRSLFLTDSA